MVGLISVFLWHGAWARSQDVPVHQGTVGKILCPVGGMPINRDLSAQTPEGPVYFCYEHCIDRYNAEPSAFLGAVQAQ